MITRIAAWIRQRTGRNSSEDGGGAGGDDDQEPGRGDEREIDGTGNPIIDEVYNGQFSAAKEIQSIQQQAEELEDGRDSDD